MIAATISSCCFCSDSIPSSPNAPRSTLSPAGVKCLRPVLPPSAVAGDRPSPSFNSEFANRSFSTSRSSAAARSAACAAIAAPSWLSRRSRETSTVRFEARAVACSHSARSASSSPRRASSSSSASARRRPRCAARRVAEVDFSPRSRTTSWDMAGGWAPLRRRLMVGRPESASKRTVISPLPSSTRVLTTFSSSWMRLAESTDDSL
mmetsp:Transcript_12516/g.31612  ORF Transcript_12516/g.31612 Transcript_12516/m.31612 type:complete len:207 (+) Transcript_12516:232-852(+)